jgi:hypothetical protein
MPIMIAFDPKDAATRPDAKTIEFGPYRVAAIVGDSLSVFDGFQPFSLATRNQSGDWIVNGLDGLTFPSVRFLPPLDERRADLERAEEEYDGRDE